MPLLDKDACLLPDRARALPAGSLAQLMAAKCLRQYWHLVFDSTPRLLDHYPPDGKAVFEPFLVWADAQALSMDWSLHLHLLAFLVAERPELATDRELVLELLGGAASRWTRADMSSNLGLLLGSHFLPGEALLAWKCSSLTEPKQVFLVRLVHEDPAPAPAGWICLGDRSEPAAQALGRTWEYRLG